MINPTCPNCKTVDLYWDDAYDMEYDAEVIITKNYGTCPKCGKEFRWKEIYIWHSNEDLEEIK